MRDRRPECVARASLVAKAQSCSAELVLSMRLLIATVLPLAVIAAGFETGVVAPSDGGGLSSKHDSAGRAARQWQTHGRDGCLSEGDTSTARIATATSSDGGRTWSPPKVLYEEKEQGKAVGDPNMLVDGNTVFVYWTRVYSPNTIKKAWTWAVKSTDNGETWSQPQEIAIPRQYTPGKQHNAIKLADGSYAMGISWDHWPERGFNARTEGEMNLSSGLLLSKDGLNWNLYGDLHVFVEKVTPGSTNGLAEPSIVQLADGEIFMLLRSGSSHHYEARSRDGGITWTPPAPSPLIGHNTPDGSVEAREPKERDRRGLEKLSDQSFPLCVSLSSDGGETWSPRATLRHRGARRCRIRA